jgi:putative membrane protein
MMWNDMGTWGWGFGWVMGGTMLVLTLVTIGLVVWAIVALSRTPTNPRVSEAPRTVLDRRLASGEISKDEYISTRQLIAQHSTETARGADDRL